MNTYQQKSESDLKKEIDAWKKDIDAPAEVSEIKQRTGQQNRALHKYCQMVANDMNAAGYDAKQVISLPIQLTGAIVKDQIFKPIMNALQDKASTTELETGDVNEVVINMQRALAEKFGITTPFPDRFGGDE